MCIIVYRPKDAKPLDKDVWSECWRMHEDGAGFAYFDENGSLKADKGYMTFNSLYPEIEKLEKAKLEFVVHFRSASPGMDVNPKNTHPFCFSGKIHKVGDTKKPRFRWAVVHNGRLPWAPTKDDSDTAMFCKEMLMPLLDQNPWFLDQIEGIILLQLAVTSSTMTNKLFIMREDYENCTTQTYVINHKSGVEDHGGWFSNYSYETHNYQSDFFRQYAGKSRVRGLAKVPDEKNDDHKLIIPDFYGWCWSFKFDCWVNFKEKHWCEGLPHRINPYDIYKLDNVARPEGWKRVYIINHKVS